MNRFSTKDCEKGEETKGENERRKGNAGLRSARRFFFFALFPH